MRRSDWPLTALGLSASLASARCICPPCPGESAAKPAVAVPSGSHLVIWDGDKGGVGSNGKSWADCDKKPDCKVTLEVKKGTGRNGSYGLKYTAQGPAWNGGGWNWFGWWPETSGTDISPYGNLAFWIRVEPKSHDLAPDPGSVTTSLGCSRGKKNSANLKLESYAKDFADGEWHKVVVPLADLTKGEGAEFDLATAWEFRISTWGPTTRDFNIYLDDIEVEKP
jgi:hypothetical protein